jgi:hypothetical protein
VASGKYKDNHLFNFLERKEAESRKKAGNTLVCLPFYRIFLSEALFFFIYGHSDVSRFT